MEENFNPEATKVNSLEVKESTKSHFFIREQTLDATLEKIAEVDKNKRKIIVYVGVHPHEGTAGLTEKYAEDWSEKYGVLVVCQPEEGTPDAIWEAHRTRCLAGTIPFLPKDVELSEDKYEDKFSLGEETFFIRFHGAPKLSTKNWKSGFETMQKRKLEIITSSHEDAPDMYSKDGIVPLRYSRPEIVQGLDKILPDVERAGYPGNVITVEYYYDGISAETDDSYIKRLLELNKKRNSEGVPLLFEEDGRKSFRKLNIKPEYLIEPKLSEEDIKDFHNNFVHNFEKMLEHLSRRIKE